MLNYSNMANTVVVSTILISTITRIGDIITTAALTDVGDTATTKSDLLPELITEATANFWTTRSYFSSA